MPKARSSSSSSEPRISGGKAVRIITATTSAYHAKIGILSSDMPGARYFRMVTVISTAAQMAEISTKVMPSSQKSELIPGLPMVDDSGGYMNQPLSGATPATSAKISMELPKT